MKYSSEETLRRQQIRKHRQELRTVRRHFAFFPTTCCKCNREFHLEMGYRLYDDHVIAVLVRDLCNECATSRSEACRVFYSGEVEV